MGKSTVELLSRKRVIEARLKVIGKGNPVAKQEEPEVERCHHDFMMAEMVRTRSLVAALDAFSGRSMFPASPPPLAWRRALS